MRAWLLVCAALALAPGQPPAPATAAHPPAHPLPPDRLQHIKTQILAKLGLSSRPTPLRAPPRDVVRKILQRAADPAPAHRDPEGMREIIAIAHRGETLNGQRLIEFRLGQEERDGDSIAIASAELLVLAETAPRARHLRYTLWAFAVGNGSVGEMAGVARLQPHGSWQRLDVTAAARRWAAGGAHQPLRLLLDCTGGCTGRVRLRLGGGQAARPLLRLRLAAPATRRRRALDCDANSHGRCCRQTYYVSFRALGWDDWIVAPEGYYANYCRGACAPFLNYHSQVVEAARLERAACCAPVRFSALSLIYFGADSNIVKRDLPEMVVEECDCP